MKKIYTYSLKNAVSSGAVMFFIGLIGGYFILNENNNIKDSALFSCIFLFGAIFLIILRITSKLELENNILSKRTFFIKIWSVSVSDITDIASSQYFNDISNIWYIKMSNGKYHRVSNKINNIETTLFSDLHQIKPQIIIHRSFPNDLINVFRRRKNDKIQIIYFIFLAIGLVFMAVLSTIDAMSK